MVMRDPELGKQLLYYIAVVGIAVLAFSIYAFRA
jgi:hypothetical protein